MNNNELLDIALPIIEDFSTMEDLEYKELEKVNESLGVLIELLTETETKNDEFRTQIIEYITLEQIQEVELLEDERVEDSIDFINYEQSNNEYLATIASNTEPLEVDEEIQHLDVLSKSAILVILAMITIYGVFYFTRYVYNQLTRHF